MTRSGLIRGGDCIWAILTSKRMCGISACLVVQHRQVVTLPIERAYHLHGIPSVQVCNKYMFKQIPAFTSAALTENCSTSLVHKCPHPSRRLRVVESKTGLKHDVLSPWLLRDCSHVWYLAVTAIWTVHVCNLSESCALRWTTTFSKTLIETTFSSCRVCSCSCLLVPECHNSILRFH